MYEQAGEVLTEESGIMTDSSLSAFRATPQFNLGVQQAECKIGSWSGRPLVVASPPVRTQYVVRPQEFFRST
jgi:hypothetical protein